ncbi:MAG: ferritin-like domain-containing protein [Armatimonadetes bacterium]|nr:ferritin-like domain-containing protein [Armatimonadota bacterium]
MESVQDRLLRYLNDAWAFEKSLIPALETNANKANDPTAKALYQEHASVTHQQEELLEARIRALGGELNRAKSFMDQMANTLSGFMNIFHDEYDQTTQDLIKSYAIEHFEMGMYQSLESFATAIGDTETAQLARSIFEQEKETAERVWSQIGPAAARALQATG